MFRKHLFFIRKVTYSVFNSRNAKYTKPKNKNNFRHIKKFWSCFENYYQMAILMFKSMLPLVFFVHVDSWRDSNIIERPGLQLLLYSFSVSLIYPPIFLHTKKEHRNSENCLWSRTRENVMHFLFLHQFRKSLFKKINK